MISPTLGIGGSIAFVFALYKGWLPISYNQNALLTVVLVVLSLIVILVLLSESRLHLFHRATGLERAWMPVYVSRLSIADTAVLIFLILLKYPYSSLGLLPKYKPTADGKHVEVPELQLEASMQIDEGDYARYDAASKAQSVPTKTTGPVKSAGRQDRLLLLPALTTPMMAVLLANRCCPVLPFGSVNTKNRFEFVDPEACRDPIKTLDLGTKATVGARIGGQQLLGRRVKRGVELDVVVEFKAPRKGEAQSKIVFRQYITFLAFLPKSAKPVYSESNAEEQKTEDLTWADKTNAALSLNLSAPNKWAAVCKDYNPIHMSSTMAKAFGFPAKIAHGNHAVASVVEQLLNGKDAGEAERGLKGLLKSNQPSFLEVQFQRPMVLPTDLLIRFGASSDQKSYAFAAEKSDKELVLGRAGAMAG